MACKKKIKDYHLPGVGLKEKRLIQTNIKNITVLYIYGRII